MYADAVRTDTRATTEELRRLWAELPDDPALEAYRLELNELGEVILNPPPANRHQLAIFEILMQLRDQLGGLVLQEPGVLTPTLGVRRPDAVWLPSDRYEDTRASLLIETPPPIVVEVLSPGNRRAEIAAKIAAYLEWGVEEVIVVALDGAVRYHRADGMHEESAFGVKLTGL